MKAAMLAVSLLGPSVGMMAAQNVPIESKSGVVIVHGLVGYEIPLFGSFGTSPISVGAPKAAGEFSYTWGLQNTVINDPDPNGIIVLQAEAGQCPFVRSDVCYDVPLVITQASPSTGTASVPLQPVPDANQLHQDYVVCEQHHATKTVTLVHPTLSAPTKITVEDPDSWQSGWGNCAKVKAAYAASEAKKLAPPDTSARDAATLKHLGNDYK